MQCFRSRFPFFRRRSFSPLPSCLFPVFLDGTVIPGPFFYTLQGSGFTFPRRCDFFFFPMIFHPPGFPPSLIFSSLISCLLPFLSFKVLTVASHFPAFDGHLFFFSPHSFVQRHVPIALSLCFLFCSSQNCRFWMSPLFSPYRCSLPPLSPPPELSMNMIHRTVFFPFPPL